MVTFLRRIRQKLIESGSFTKYLLYAMGEILLVVIGILLALQVNNWNEERKLDETTHIILRQIQADIVENIQASLSLTNYYQRKDSVFWVMRNTKMEPSDFETGRFAGQIDQVLENRLVSKGYESLVDHPGLRPGELTDILDEIEDLQTLVTRTNRIFDEIFENRQKHTEYRNDQYEWTYHYFWYRKRSPERFDYYANDPRLKSYVAEYAALYQQLLFGLELFKRMGLSTYKLISEELEDDPSDIPEMIRDYYIELPSDSLLPLTGTYQQDYVPPLNSTENFDEVDSVAIAVSAEGLPIIRKYLNDGNIEEKTLNIRSSRQLEEQLPFRSIQYILNEEDDLEIKNMLGINYVYNRKSY